MTEIIDFSKEKNSRTIYKTAPATLFPEPEAPTIEQQNSRYVYSEADYRKFYESVYGQGTFIANPAFTDEDAEDLFLGDKPEVFGYQNFEYKLDPDKVSFDEWVDYITHIDVSELVKLDDPGFSEPEYEFFDTETAHTPYEVSDGLPTLQAIQELLS